MKLNLLSIARNFLAINLGGFNGFVAIISENQKNRIINNSIVNGSLLAVADFNFSHRGILAINEKGQVRWLKKFVNSPMREIGKRWGPFCPPSWQKT